MHIKRDIENQISAALENQKILVLTGPKGIGKTHLLKRLKRRIKPASLASFINLENLTTLQSLNESPHNILKIIPKLNGTRHYLFLDEVQNLKQYCSFLRTMQHDYSDRLKLVVSSSIFDCDLSDSECVIYEVKPLSFREFVRYKDRESLYDLFSNQFEHNIVSKSIPKESQDKINDLFLEYILYGGYPSVVLNKDEESKKQELEDIINSFINYEVPRTGIRSPEKFYNLLKLLAERAGDFFTLSEIAASLGVSSPTVENYIQILKQNMKIKVLYPYAKNYSKEINKTPKFYFNDLGLRNTVLDNFEPISDRWDRENYFENIVFNFFKAKQGIESLHFWRTQTKHEVDFIVNGSFAFDVSFNGGRVNKSKYKTFLKKYPDMDLNFVTHSNVAGTLGVLDI